MKIDKQLLDSLTEKAMSSERLRFAYDLRTSPNDNSQRMLNALEPGTVMPIHRHRSSSETMVMVRGKLIERLYNEDGSLAEEFVMAPNGDTSLREPQDKLGSATVPMVQIEAGQWHSLEVLESGTVIFEAKDGAYEPLSSEDIMTID